MLAVREAHVAQQALGVVAQRDGQLAQVARELGALAQDLARDDVRLADDLTRILARLRAHRCACSAASARSFSEILAAGDDGALGLRPAPLRAAVQPARAPRRRCRSASARAAASSCSACARASLSVC